MTITRMVSAKFPATRWLAFAASLTFALSCSSTTEPGPPNGGNDDHLTFNTNSESSCDSPVNKTGVIKATSANAIIVEDTTNPPAFTQADYQDILSSFETIVAPSNIAAFGGHTDIDNNQKIIIFYTIEVNRLTDPGSGSFVGGFFFSRDLFPRTGEVTTPSGKRLQACAGSNAAEMFYMLAPDPAGTINNNPRSTEFVKRTTAGTIAHEYQHLINASRRLYVTPAAAFPEEVWLDEGLSHIAEELAYYRATPFTPMLNLTGNQITDPSVTDPLITYQTANLARLSSYLRSPAAQSPFGETPRTGTSSPGDWDDLQTRGAIWSFLRWASDRGFLPQEQVWNRMVRDATAVGADNLRALVGADLGGRFREWAATTYVDDAAGQNVPVTDRGDCGQTVSLAVNELCSASGATAASMTVTSGSSQQEYTVVVHYFNGLARDAISVNATATNVVPVSGPPTPTTAPVYQSSPASLRELTPDFSFERSLRHRERRDLPSLVEGGVLPRAALTVAPAGPRFDIAPSAAFTQPSWNFRSVLPLLGSNMNAFPLQVFSIGPSPFSVSVVDGGAAYLRFGLLANATSTVSVTSGGGQLPAGASVWVVRTK